jgi:hypothetical protein
MASIAKSQNRGMANYLKQLLKLTITMDSRYFKHGTETGAHSAERPSRSAFVHTQGCMLGCVCDGVVMKLSEDDR